MSKMSRFIQFNDETVEAKTMLLYERLARALANRNDLELTERKLIEFQIAEKKIAMSVFWRHRHEETMHLGRLSDIYLLAGGFWTYFDLPVWKEFVQTYKQHHLKRFAYELFMLVEEFRLMDLLAKKRPGMKKAFRVRRKTYTEMHKTNVRTNMQKGHIADALLSECYVNIHEGIYAASAIDWEELPFSMLQSILVNAYELQNTEDSSYIVHRIITAVEEILHEDLSSQYYSYADAFVQEEESFYYHKGMVDAEVGEEEVKETIEEQFDTWHEANEDESGTHLEYELEHGRSGKSDLSSTAEGSDEATIEEVGYGRSKGDTSEQFSEDDKETTGRQNDEIQAGTNFGSEHLNVVYEEKKIESNHDREQLQKLTKWREEQKPFVRSITEEMKKRMEMKQSDRRERLMNGRLSSNLMTLFVDERPKPFYRKNAPSIQLDAVFGLLVDASASMIDKLDETKQAVLLFHDVLRNLQVQHEISSYTEDAFKASADIQPNIFGIMHTFQEQYTDNALRILSFEAAEDNRDGFAIRWMMKRLQRRPEQHKFLLVFSDGEPSAYGYDRNGVVDTAEAVLEAEKNGVSVIHLFLSTEESSEDQMELFSTMFGNKTASANTVEQFTEQTIRILRKLLNIVVRI